jgi:hypothetical protein
MELTTVNKLSVSGVSDEVRSHAAKVSFDIYCCGIVFLFLS